jgi:hypothetical protein
MLMPFQGRPKFNSPLRGDKPVSLNAQTFEAKPPAVVNEMVNDFPHSIFLP